jgi:hypothetical protein
MKVQIDKTYPMPCSADVAWEFLQNVEAVTACMPGAKITERLDAGRVSGEGAGTEVCDPGDFRWLCLHSPTHCECDTDGDNPRQFSILDCRFSIGGKRLRRKRIHRFVPLTLNPKSKIQNCFI